MSIDFMRPEADELRPRISVVGVGGAGGNAIANMIDAEVQGVDFIVANTDAQALNASAADTKIQLGMKITEGLGAGSRPEIGRAAAEETIEEIEAALEGAHMCFIAAGMGGGTGTGAAPVIAKTAREKGILTVGVVTKPFAFEGARRGRAADSGIEELQAHVDTLIVIPNQNLFRLATPDTTFKEAFEMADEVLKQGVRGITDLMIMPGFINLDFNDVKSVMGELGKAMMGTGEGEGDNRAIEAAEKAISNPLLDGVSMNGATGVVISIMGGSDMKLMEVDEAASHIKELVDDDANIIWGSAFDPELEGKIRVSVIATGIDGNEDMKAPRRTETSENKGPTLPGATRPRGEVFSFPGAASGSLSTPKADFSIGGAQPARAEAETAGKDDTLDLTDAMDGMEDDAGSDDAETHDLLLLDDDEVLAEPVASAPIAPPSDEDAATVAATPREEPVERAPLLATTGNARKATPSPAPGGGGTLFERMSNIARGAAAAGNAESEEPGFRSDRVDIPGFLNRQNNQ